MTVALQLLSISYRSYIRSRFDKPRNPTRERAKRQNVYEAYTNVASTPSSYDAFPSPRTVLRLSRFVIPDFEVRTKPECLLPSWWSTTLFVRCYVHESVRCAAATSRIVYFTYATTHLLSIVNGV